MSTAIGNLSVVVSARTDPLTSGLSDAAKKVDWLDRKVNRSGSRTGFRGSIDGLTGLRRDMASTGLASRAMASAVGASTAKVAAGLASGGTAAAAMLGFDAASSSIQGISSLLTDSVKLAASAETTRAAFETMLGSAGAASRIIEEIRQFAADSPFNTSRVTDQAKQLLAYGIAADQVVPTLRMLGDVASGTGGDISRVSLAYGQVATAGRLTGDELRQFTEAGIPIVESLAKVLGKPTAEIKSMVEAGRIGFPDVIKAFRQMTDSGGKFAGLTERFGESLTGKLEQLADAAEMAKREFGGILIDELKLKDAARDLGNFIDRAKAGTNELRPIVRLVGDLARAAAQVGWELLKAAKTYATAYWSRITDAFPQVGILAEQAKKFVKDLQDFRIDPLVVFDFAAGAATPLILMGAALMDAIADAIADIEAVWKRGKTFAEDIRGIVADIKKLIESIKFNWDIAKTAIGDIAKTVSDAADRVQKVVDALIALGKNWAFPKLPIGVGFGGKEPADAAGAADGRQAGAIDRIVPGAIDPVATAARAAVESVREMVAPRSTDPAREPQQIPIYRPGVASPADRPDKSFSGRFWDKIGDDFDKDVARAGSFWPMLGPAGGERKLSMPISPSASDRTPIDPRHIIRPGRPMGPLDPTSSKGPRFDLSLLGEDPELRKQLDAANRDLLEATTPQQAEAAAARKQEIEMRIAMDRIVQAAAIRRSQVERRQRDLASESRREVATLEPFIVQSTIPKEPKPKSSIGDYLRGNTVTPEAERKRLLLDARYDAMNSTSVEAEKQAVREIERLEAKFIEEDIRNIKQPDKYKPQTSARLPYPVPDDIVQKVQEDVSKSIYSTTQEERFSSLRAIDRLIQQSRSLEESRFYESLKTAVVERYRREDVRLLAEEQNPPRPPAARYGPPPSVPSTIVEPSKPTVDPTKKGSSRSVIGSGTTDEFAAVSRAVDHLPVVSPVEMKRIASGRESQVAFVPPAAILFPLLSATAVPTLRPSPPANPPRPPDAEVAPVPVSPAKPFSLSGLMDGFGRGRGLERAIEQTNTPGGILARQRAELVKSERERADKLARAAAEKQLAAIFFEHGARAAGAIPIPNRESILDPDLREIAAKRLPALADIDPTKAARLSRSINSTPDVVRNAFGGLLGGMVPDRVGKLDLGELSRKVAADLGKVRIPEALPAHLLQLSSKIRAAALVRMDPLAEFYRHLGDIEKLKEAGEINRDEYALSVKDLISETARGIDLQTQFPAPSEFGSQEAARILTAPPSMDDSPASLLSALREIAKEELEEARRQTAELRKVLDKIAAPAKLGG